jgi:hypothetical protein
VLGWTNEQPAGQQLVRLVDGQYVEDDHLVDQFTRVFRVAGGQRSTYKE